MTAATLTLTDFLLARIAEGKAEEADFVAEARARLFPDRIKGLSAQLAKLGQSESFALVERTDRGGQRVYRYRAVFPQRALIYTFHLVDDGKVARLQVERD